MRMGPVEARQLVREFASKCEVNALQHWKGNWIEDAANRMSYTIGSLEAVLECALTYGLKEATKTMKRVLEAE